MSTQRGFSYVEVLLSVVLLAVLLVPAMQALQSGMTGNQSGALLARELALREKMERVLTQPFATLYAETYAPAGNTLTSVSATLSDPVGAADRRAVVLYRYDPSAGALSAADTGLVAVTVYYANEGPAGALRTLVGRWW